MEINLVGIIDKIYNTITFDVFIKFTVLYFFIIWISVLLWVIKDISNRTNSILLQIISVLIILFFTPFGIFIYLLIRPSNTLFEKYYSEIEENLDIFHDIIEERLKEKLDCKKQY
ncbi:hypothetical protein LRZ95_00760, partial [Candidatus Gracilibacteria bacterium]|nr:hypothetical protein [Candidatus Gracilibacteria bacterium]